MTPYQRMKLFTLVTAYDSAVKSGDRMKVLQEISEFVEQIEFLAHNAGQDHQIELHKEHQERYSTEICTWRDWTEN